MSLSFVKKLSTGNTYKNQSNNNNSYKSRYPLHHSEPVMLIQRRPTCPCGGGCPRCQQGKLPNQPKLKIGASNDRYEQEADRVADQVMRMPESECTECEDERIQTKPLSSQITPLIQRQKGEEEPEIMTKLNSGSKAVSSNIQSQLNASKGSGSPLPKNTRNTMETAFGMNFSGVRIHTDSNAAQMNKGINAKAFTHGRDVFFNREKFSPDTNSGKYLLAHELTHVVQQSGAERIHASKRNKLYCLYSNISLPTAQNEVVQRSPADYK